ncbi:MAG: hypothetical protein SGPRY_010873, partial [Prymnesium sp.]
LLCWANPIVRRGDAAHTAAFMSATATPPFRFVAYGGFVLLDSNLRVVRVQALCSISHAFGLSISFHSPRPWRPEFSEQLDARFQPVTLPSLKRAGALAFCWIHPNEALKRGPEQWVPSTTGGFVYEMYDGSAIYFPVQQREVAKRARRSSSLGNGSLRRLSARTILSLLGMSAKQ